MKGKIRITNNKPSALLPSLGEVFGLLSLPSSLSDFALNIAQENQLPLPVDRKTLTLAKKSSVKIDTARKIIRFVASHIPYGERGESPFEFFNSDFRKLARQASREPGNSGVWRMSLWGYNKADPDSFPLTKTFILKRCDAEAELFERCRTSDHKLDVSVEIYAREVLIDQMSVEAALREVLKTLDVSPREISKATATTMVRLYLDFFLWVLAYAEKDLIDFYVCETGYQDPTLLKEGIFGQILPVLNDGKYCTPLDSLFDRWRHRVAEKIFDEMKPFSWRKLASFMPAPTCSSRLASDTDKDKILKNKYRELASWRSGKVVPSEQKLRGFIGKLFPPGREQEWCFWTAQVAIAMNRLYKEIEQLTVFPNDEVVEFFAKYKNYRHAVEVQP